MIKNQKRTKQKRKNNNKKPMDKQENKVNKHH